MLKQEEDFKVQLAGLENELLQVSFNRSLHLFSL